MTGFFKRLSRSKTDDSYIDDYESPPGSRAVNSRYEKYDGRPQSSRNSFSQHNALPTKDTEITHPDTAAVNDMYPRPQAPQEAYGSTRGMSNGGHNSVPLSLDGPGPISSNSHLPGVGMSKTEAPPDLLTQAFNQALRPYTDKIEQLESQLADMQQWVEQLEQQRAELHSWIDKRGLRPDVPPSIAKAMDSTTPDAAQSLNAQLDRKITIVNFDLHRLQDDLNDSISAAHFAAAMSKFLPDISRLSSLPTGPRYAFDLVLKLGGNLNSHGGLDSGDPVDLEARRDFYHKLDGAMCDVVRRRFAEGEDWSVGREIKRIEKTAAYLRNFGIEPYFPATLEVMRSEAGTRSANEFRTSGAPRDDGPRGTPPRYQ